MRRIWLASATLLAGAALVAAGALSPGRVTAPGTEAVRSAPFGDASNPPAGSGARAAAIAPEVVVRQLSREGFYGFRRVAREGHRYVIHAYGPRGRFVRVVADAGSGRILGTRALASAGVGPGSP